MSSIDGFSSRQSGVALCLLFFPLCESTDSFLGLPEVARGYSMTKERSTPFLFEILALNFNLRGAPKIFPLTNLVFWTNQGGGGLTEDQLFCKIVKTKLTFVNGQKCDETHNT